MHVYEINFFFKFLLKCLHFDYILEPLLDHPLVYVPSCSFTINLGFVWNPFQPNSFYSPVNAFLSSRLWSWLALNPWKLVILSNDPLTYLGFTYNWRNHTLLNSKKFNRKICYFGTNFHFLFVVDEFHINHLKV